VHNCTFLRPPECSWSDRNTLVHTCAQLDYAPTSSMLLVRHKLSGVHLCTNELLPNLFNAPGPTGSLCFTSVHNSTMLRPPPCSWFDTNPLVYTFHNSTVVRPPECSWSNRNTLVSHLCTATLCSDLLHASGPTGTLLCTPVHDRTLLRPPPCSWSDINSLVHTGSSWPALGKNVGYRTSDIARPTSRRRLAP
jgi:hypothetical protein